MSNDLRELRRSLSVFLTRDPVEYSSPADKKAGNVFYYRTDAQPVSLGYKVGDKTVSNTNAAMP